MHVTAHAAALAAHNKTELRVDLESGKTVNNIHTRFFEFLGPVDVLLFVKPGLEFHHSRHLLAEAPGLKKALYNGGRSAAAVKRLLDGNDVGVKRRLLQKPQNAGKRIVGVINHLIVPGDRLKDAAFGVKGRGNSRMHRRVLKPRLIQGHQSHELRKRKRHL